MLGTLVYRYKYMYVTKHNTLKDGNKRIEYWVYNKLNDSRVKIHGAGAYSMCKKLCKLVTDSKIEPDSSWMSGLVIKLRGDVEC